MPASSDLFRQCREGYRYQFLCGEVLEEKFRRERLGSFDGNEKMCIGLVLTTRKPLWHPTKFLKTTQNKQSLITLARPTPGKPHAGGVGV